MKTKLMSFLKILALLQLSTQELKIRVVCLGYHVVKKLV